MEPNVQVLISQQTQYGEYKDALYIPLSQYESLSGTEVDALIAERVASWIDSIENPPAPIDPTPEGLLSDLQVIEDTKQDIITQLSTIDTSNVDPDIAAKISDLINP